MCFTSCKVTKNISILKSQWDVSKWKTTPIGVLFMPFLGAKPKHYKPYLTLYQEFYQKKLQPVDILVVQADVLDFLSISCNSHFVQLINAAEYLKRETVQVF